MAPSLSLASPGIVPDTSSSGWWWSVVSRTAIAATVVLASSQIVQAINRSRARKGRPLPVPPGASPILGHIPILAKHMKPNEHIDVAITRIMEAYPEIGGFFQLNLVAVRFAAVCDPSAAREIIVTQNLPKSPTYDSLHPFIGRKSILVAKDEIWSRQRKAFNPGFAHAHLRSMVPVFVERSQLLLPRLQRAADSGAVILMHKELTLLTLDIITQAILSTDLGFLTSDKPPELLHAFTELIDITASYADAPHLSWMRLLPWNWLHFQRLQRKFDKTIIPLIQARLDAPHTEGPTSGRQDILDMALASARADGGRLDLEDVLAQIKTFLFAGHDTTSSAVAFTVYEVSQHPHVQAALIEEVDRVCQGRLPTVEDLPELKYTTAVLKESLRLWPLGGSARMGPPGTVVNGYDVGGVVLYCSHIHIHRSTELWGPNAGEFIPERWLDKAYIDALHPMAFQAFSKGPRDCIGQTFALMEGKTLLAMLYQRFTFDYAGEQPEEQGSRITSFPRYHVPVTVHPRAK